MDLGRRSSSSTKVLQLQAAVAAFAFLFLALDFAFATSHPCSFTSIYNFGDSNSDTGSVSATFGRVKPPNGLTFFGKPSGRYCDGRLVVDFLAEKLGLPYLAAYLDSIGADFKHGANFAASGSTIQNLDANLCAGGYDPMTLQVQVSQFEQFRDRSVESYGEVLGNISKPKVPLPTPESFSSALFTIDSGQNDIHAGLTSMSEEQVKASIPHIIDQFSVALEKLYSLGASSFWIHNTGPIGCLTYFLVKRPPQLNNTDPIGCIKSYNEVAQEFNKQLKEKISGLQSQFSKASLVYVDMYSAKYSLISQGKNEGFGHPLGKQCCGRTGKYECGRNPKVDVCSDPSDYIIWDSIHYTEAANKWIAGRILDGDFSEPKVPIAEACSYTRKSSINLRSLL